MLGSMIAEELSSIGWDKLMPADAVVRVADVRKWAQHAISKAIWTYVQDNQAIKLVVSGTFTNVTNFPKPGTPYPQPTVGIMIDGWVQTPSHRKLYDAILPFHTKNDADDDQTTCWIDFFQRVFVDWLGVLPIVAGQDATTMLPLIAPPAPNTAPPYFHSMTGATLAANRYYPARQLEVAQQTYPVQLGDKPAQGLAFSPPSTGIADAKANAVSLWDVDLLQAQTILAASLLTWDLGGGTHDPIELMKQRQPFEDRWTNKLKTLRKEQRELRSSPTPDKVRLTAIDAEIKATHDDCLADKPAVLPMVGMTYVDDGYPACLSRVAMIDYERRLPLEFNTSIAVKPSKVAVGTTDKDAPDLSAQAQLEPTPPDYEWPQLQAWYSVQPQLTFPNFEKHARACAAAIRDAQPSSMRDAWELAGTHLQACLLDSQHTAGGGTGYAYGLPANPWAGTIVVFSAVWN
jgi:hypothetical protein